jgi:hypothetical protein
MKIEPDKDRFVMDLENCGYNGEVEDFGILRVLEQLCA